MPILRNREVVAKPAKQRKKIISSRTTKADSLIECSVSSVVILYRSSSCKFAGQNILNTQNALKRSFIYNDDKQEINGELWS